MAKLGCVHVFQGEDAYFCGAVLLLIVIIIILDLIVDLCVKIYPFPLSSLARSSGLLLI